MGSQTNGRLALHKGEDIWNEYLEEEVSGGDWNPKKWTYIQLGLWTTTQFTQQKFIYPDFLSSNHCLTPLVSYMPPIHPSTWCLQDSFFDTTINLFNFSFCVLECASWSDQLCFLHLVGLNLLVLCTNATKMLTKLIKNPFSYETNNATCLKGLKLISRFDLFIRKYGGTSYVGMG